MSVQFGRFTEVLIGSMKMNSEDLSIRFDVPFDDDTDPNESVIVIYNLTETTINKMKRGQKVTVNAGYQQDRGVILEGFLVRLFTTYDGADKKTMLYVLDSAPIDEKKTVQKTYKSGISAERILRDLAALLKLNISVLVLPKNKVYAKGYAAKGEILDVMKKVAKDCGAQIYINKRKIFIRSIKVGDDSRFVLSAETGLLDTPQPFEEEREGVLIKGYKVKCLLQFRLTTASIVTLESKYVKGKFRVRSGIHTNDGDNFMTNMEVIA